MYRQTIVLNTLEQAKQFVHVCTAQEFNIELIAGDKVVHAKSIIGVLSMELGQPLVVSVEKEDLAAVEAFAEKLKPFIAD